MAVAGAGAAGWPTSMWITRPPAASMRPAAAITSITMNGGTSLRAEGDIRRFAAFSMVATLGQAAREAPAPLLPYSAVSVAQPIPGPYQLAGSGAMAAGAPPRRGGKDAKGPVLWYR
jgi:hypothetical protein